MRSAGNFNPEWGYLAPAPSFMRTMRVVLVATAIGATAGAAVVISLIDRPAGRSDDTASTTPRAIVTSAQAAQGAAMPAAAASVAAPVEKAAVKPAMTQPSAGASVVAPQTASAVGAQGVTPPAAALAPSADDAVVPSPPVAPSQPSLHVAVPDTPAASDAAAETPKSTTGMAALSEASPSSEAVHAADEPDQALIPPEPIPAEKKAKHHLAIAAASDTRNRPVPSLGAVLRRIFNPHAAGTSYYPNR